MMWKKSDTSTTTVVSKEVKGICFGFYSHQEVCGISVKHITSPILLDGFGKPVPGGLYDAAMGPLEQNQSCITCGEGALQCPGHFGHIELVLPVYNPLVFRPLVKIMKLICLFCHRFKMKEQKVQEYVDRLQLLYKANSGNGFECTQVSCEENFFKAEAEKYNKRHWTSTTLAKFKELVKNFMDEVPSNKCDNCGANVPTIRNEGIGKIFQLPLQKSKLTANYLSGLRLSMAELMNWECKKSFLSEQAANDTGTLTKGSELMDGDLCGQFRYLTTTEVRIHVNLLWAKEIHLCSLIWGAQQYLNGAVESSEFFMDAILVPPNRFRPPNKLQGMVMEHPMNVLYAYVIQANMNLMNVLRNNASTLAAVVSSTQATTLWLNLQNSINRLIDSSSAIGKKTEQIGVRQLLEKKEGLFRMNLMGKRVNYSCRSVISPDPYIAVNEIGIPPYFAERLSYPEKVTYWNVEKLRQLVINGPSVYPGATHVEDEFGVVVHLNSLSKSQRVAVSKTLLSTPRSTANSMGGFGANTASVKATRKVVYRHLQDGDALLVNRQPTLHKPSLMGHIARVLKGEKTLRLHYANCSAYNADFDGDEMNVHFPQDEIGRSEAYYIVNANQQYIVPTSGDPIRGLIQDHIVGATLLTKRDTFLTKEEYQELVYSACASSTPASHAKVQKQCKIGIVAHDRFIRTLLPAILKPKPLWTGKQVITTILNYVSYGRPPYSLKSTGKVSGDYWGRNSGETKLLIEKNELLHGAIDKAQFGRFGLVHAFREFYGAESTGELLSVLSRLFTSFLQMFGFTCGMADLLFVLEGERERIKKLEDVRECALKAHKRFFGFDTIGMAGSGELKEELEKVLQTKGNLASVQLDRIMSSAMNVITSNINSFLFPKALLKPFPENCLSLMTVTGAKGGLVNFTQISSLVGQQELEGKRVPRMSSGKTLPCFPPWDVTARAGGFISDRFLTGLRPQEYYFHCMAGRDGLVDTAVKTSRSGYLQRCLIKNLECLSVHYDYTVRDSDGSIIQFRYGEDGVDVMKTKYLTEFKALALNQELISQRIGGVQVAHKAISELGETGTSSFETVSEAFEDQMRNFLRGLPKFKRDRLHLQNHKDCSTFKDLMKLNFLSSSAEPGEPVGVLAAQSIGEPSTQMTLNTFHFAGRGEMNVTLGIPRLREILMTAATEISTPVMTCPLRSGKTRHEAECLAAQLRRIHLIDVIERVEVSFIPLSVQSGQMRKVYSVKLLFRSGENLPPHLQLRQQDYESAIQLQFIPFLTKEMAKAITARTGQKAKDSIQVVLLTSSGEEKNGNKDDEDDGLEATRVKTLPHGGEHTNPDEDDDEYVAEEDGADAEKWRGQGTDERAYDDDVDEDEDLYVNDLPQEEDMEVGSCDEGHKEGHISTLNRYCGLENDMHEARNSSLAKHKHVKETVDKVQSLFEGLTCTMQFSVSQSAPYFLLSEMVERIAKQVTICSVDKIDRVTVIDYGGNASMPALQTEGINFEGLWSYADDLDVNKMTTNSIASILEIYGVEAARATIVAEIKNVFGSYGIAVDIRHLSLIADFMTHAGGYRPCNRIGIESSNSPFLKMSFETVSKFLVESILEKHCDYLQSPSSRIILGQVVEVGTGGCDLLQNVNSES